MTQSPQQTPTTTAVVPATTARAKANTAAQILSVSFFALQAIQSVAPDIIKAHPDSKGIATFFSIVGVLWKAAMYWRDRNNLTTVSKLSDDVPTI